MNYFSKIEGMLYSYKSTQAEIKNLDIDIIELQNDYTGCKAIGYEEHSQPTNKFNSSVENEIISKEKKIQHLESVKYYKQNQINKIDNALDTLTKREIEIVKMRYFEKITNRKIAERLDLTEQYISKVNADIINKLIPLIFLQTNIN